MRRPVSLQCVLMALKLISLRQRSLSLVERSLPTLCREVEPEASQRKTNGEIIYSREACFRLNVISVPLETRLQLLDILNDQARGDMDNSYLVCSKIHSY